MKKSNLDEMQEQALLRIEHTGCWLAFWGLLAAMAIQGILGAGIRELAGEWIVFIGLCLYLLVSCLRCGIWDRTLKANRKTNLIVSLIAGAAVGVFDAVLFLRYDMQWPDLALIAVIPAVITFVLCFAALTVSAAIYKKRREKLDRE
ncbi:hypothetical protein MR626_13130 [bacterium]|nr:hypothetical protein [bacterium]